MTSLPTAPRGLRVMVSCGEASGDLYAAALTASLREADPRLEVFGFGGPRLAAAGADLVGTFEGVSVTGLSEAGAVLARSWVMLRALGQAARVRRPDVFVAVDFPDFNFRLLPVVHALGIPIVYYISPQLWAWRAGRMATVRRYVAKMLVIFPFEVPIYERAGVPVEFVGHPLVELAASTRPRHAFLSGLGLDPDAPTVALLPGSRPNEVRRNLPAMAEALPQIWRVVPRVQFVVAKAPSLDDALFGPLRSTDAPAAALVEDATDDVLASADVAVTASGTATVQTALHGTPMVIVYRVAPLTYAIGRRLVRVPNFGMVNLIAGRTVVPELIQHAYTAENVAREVVSLLTDEGRRTAMRGDLSAVVASLGGAGASRRAADAVRGVVAHAARTAHAR